MADVRNLLRQERAARRITHPHVTYSTTGKLICLVCQLQLKSEALWAGHLRTPQHVARSSKFEEQQTVANAASEPSPMDEDPNGNTPEEERENAMPSKKRKTSPTNDDEQERANKRSKNEVSRGSQMNDHQEAGTPVMLSPHALDLPSRPSPTPTHSNVPESTTALVDEDEWAAFEQEIAAASMPVSVEATISAPAWNAAEIAKKSEEETYTERKARLEEEQEAEKEDATRKLEDEFEEMKGFEERVRKLKEKRDALRANASNLITSAPGPTQFGNGTDTDRNGVHSGDEKEDSEEDSSEEEDDWDGFRLRA